MYPEFTFSGKSRDSLLISRLIWTDIDEDDFRLRKRNPNYPAKLIGLHSLKAWGYRLGVLKGEFGETADWATWSPAMQTYCEGDVDVEVALVRHIERQKYSEQAIELEHEFARIIYAMCNYGVAFDEAAAARLYAELAGKRDEIRVKLESVFPPTRIEMKTPAYWLVGDKQFPTKSAAGKGAVRGPNRVKEIPFNPASRVQVADRLMALGWKPEKETDGGQPKVDEAVLEGLPYPEAKPLAEFFMLQKRIGQIAEGKEGWLKLCRNGRIHGSVITNRAVTGRCGHLGPNLAQVPRVGSPYGIECRALFTCAGSNAVLVGADAAGLELRCLAHYLARWDSGEYAKIVLDGDVHTANQLAFGLPEGKTYRGPAKNGIYCLIYGGGDHKLGTTLFPVDLFGVLDDEEYVKRGKRARAKFRKAVPAFGQLVDGVQAAVKSRGSLRGLDGRILRIRSAHSALNTLLQSAGAIAVKQATVFWERNLLEMGLVKGRDFHLVLHVHDEVQAEAKDHATGEIVGKAFVDAVAEAGRYFNFRCPLSGEYKIGRNWAETH